MYLGNDIVTCQVACLWFTRQALNCINWFIAPGTVTQLETTGSYSAIPILHIFQFTVTHALGFSVFTSRILATDFQHSHCHFKSHKKYFLHSLIQLLPLSFSCQFRRLDSTRLNSTPLLPDHILAGWRLETRLFIARLPTLLDSTRLYSVGSSDCFLL
jgi:hypothetical protein